MDREWDVLAGMDASRRVGWAKFFTADEARAQAELLSGTLLSLLLDLADAVLYGRKAEAFSLAWRIRFRGDDR